MNIHVCGLKCPECGLEWDGHAMVGLAYECCPSCYREDDTSPQPYGEVYPGSKIVAGCDNHATFLPCPFCPTKGNQ